jgi:GDP-mannose 6-dehydrogenase
MPPTQSSSPRRIAVCGLGYVGCVTAACLSSLGHRVVGVDKDEFKVKKVNEGKAPFFEPQLEELVEQGIQSGRLSASTDIAEALTGSDAVLLCVGTPSLPNGDLDLSFLSRVCQEIAAWQAESGQAIVVAIRSTVFPGTAEYLRTLFPPSALVSFVSNPEFLREGVAVRDFEEPSLLVIGGDAEPAALVASLYDGLPVQASLVSIKTAEMIKYACNAFHAVKISFANEIGDLSQAMGIDGAEVMATLCADKKLNASAAYLKPGFAFGGSCLPKDLRAIVHRSRSHDLRLPLLESAIPSNDSHLARAAAKSLALPGQKLAVLGLAFKPNTDDLRESPSIPLIEFLMGKGRQIRVFDAHIRLEEKDGIYGGNKNFLLNAIPHIGTLLEPNLAAVLEWADSLILTYKPSKEQVAAIAASGKPVLDLSGSGLDHLA